MDKKLFDSLDESLKEKLRNCQSEAEMQKVIADAGLQELSIDMLESISGGYYVPYVCHTAVNLSGDRCGTFRFQ